MIKYANLHIALSCLLLGHVHHQLSWPAAAACLDMLLLQAVQSIGVTPSLAEGLMKHLAESDFFTLDEQK